MKLFQSAARKEASSTAFASSRSGDVQQSPIAVLLEAGEQSGQIKVDLCLHTGPQLIVAGWRTTPMQLFLQVDGQNGTSREISIDRIDVNKHFQLPPEAQCGFVLTADVAEFETASHDIRLQWKTSEGLAQTSKPLSVKGEAQLTDAERSALGPALWLISNDMPINSPEWRHLIAKSPVATTSCRSARGFLEGAAACDQTQDAVVVGWVVQKPGTRVWLEDAAGRCYALDDAFKRFRQDVHEAVGHDFGHGSREAGFVLRIQGLKAGAVLRLKAMTEAGIHTLSETGCTTLPLDPVAAARWLFAVGTPLSELHQRIPLVDEPVLAPLIKNRQSIWNELPVEHRRLGVPATDPQASVIIPLHGRIDFVEHQLIEFAKDAWLNTHAEIIYVLDDPKLVEEFKFLAETLHRLYKISFQWVWGHVNRGFSGANNLGAQFATSPYLIFLNSDAFPQKSGWIQSLIDTLDKNPDLGAVGPRLVFGDGGIQHAGMEFLRKEDLRIWVNHHPRMGLDPSLDPHHSLVRVPAVTGACIALRRTDFDAAQGWDTGYLIGDFEDSDLCLKLRDRGMHIGYLPSVQLTHLERQSFKLLGQDEFRQRVVIYNAVRHQTRWPKFLQVKTTADAATAAD